MKNALFLCTLLVTASAIRVYQTPNPNGAVEAPNPNSKSLAEVQIADPPFVQCYGTSTCRVLLDITTAQPPDPTDLPTIQGTIDSDKMQRYVKVELRCCAVTLPADKLDTNCPQGNDPLLTSESDWVLIEKNPQPVAVNVQLPPSKIDKVFQQTEKCQIAIKQRRTNVGGIVVEASNPADPSDPKTTPAGYLRVDFFDTNAVINGALGGKPNIDVPSSTFQAITLSIPQTYHSASAGDYLISVKSATKNVVLSKTANGPDQYPDLTILNNEVTCPTPFALSNKCTLTFYARRLTVTQSAKFGVQQATTDLSITHGTLPPLTFSITNSQLFAAAVATQAPTALAPGAIISVNGETGVVSQASLQNRTVVVESVHATNVPDDEYSGVSAGIVYAAVGSAFVFVCVLGLIAAKLGSKAALKGV